MVSIAIASFIALSGLFALTVIGASVRRAAPQVAALRQQLSALDQTLAVRVRIIETIVSVDDGKVVAFPVRPRPLLQPGLRAAA